MAAKKKVKRAKKGKKATKRKPVARKKVAKKKVAKKAKKKVAKKVKKKVKAKKRVTKKVAKKKVAKKVVKKKLTRRTKAPAKKKVVKTAPARAPVAPVAPAAKPATPQPLPAEERIGVVTHYYTHLSVAVVELDAGVGLREGDTVHIKGHTSDFTQTVQSMEIDHMHVSAVHTGQSFGLKVKEHAREHDVVYRVKIP